MTEIPIPPRPTLATTTGEEFPIRRIWCVGRNYAAHVREMGNDEREPPFFFAKPAGAAVPSGDVPYPPMTEDLHHEVELVIAIGTGGADIPENEALDHVWGAAVGIDLTRRDLQAEYKASGRPWDMAKGFDASAPMGQLMPVAEVPSLSAGVIALSVDGAERQRGDLSEMIWSVPEIVATLSRYVALAPGDVVMTGTPSGVGPLVRGAVVEARIEGLPPLDIRIA